MARIPLYSRTPRRRVPMLGHDQPEPDPPASRWTAQRLRAAAWVRAHERWFWAGALLVLALVVGAPGSMRPVTAHYSLEEIDRAVRESIAKEPLPSAAAAAHAAIAPAVVRVVGLRNKSASELTQADVRKADRADLGPGDKGEKGEPEFERGRSVGTGVVIVDKGLILTNLHVVSGADRIRVTFWNGHHSDAMVVSVQTENDLAVLQAKSLPDDLNAATLRSTSGLSPGDEVIAVGYPFGIGPSVSQGVVSGLKREFRSPEGERILTNLIQFDAAANPGNSGGPLVTMDGAVVGIVTAIMNPNDQRTFIGIGFAVPIENAAAAVGLPPF